MLICHIPCTICHVPLTNIPYTTYHIGIFLGGAGEIFQRLKAPLTQFKRALNKQGSWGCWGHPVTSTSQERLAAGCDDGKLHVFHGGRSPGSLGYPWLPVSQKDMVPIKGV